MFGFDMVQIAAQLKAFQDQSERLVNAVEQIQNDIVLIKASLNIAPAVEPKGEYTDRQLVGIYTEETEQQKKIRAEHEISTLIHKVD